MLVKDLTCFINSFKKKKKKRKMSIQKFSGFAKRFFSPSAELLEREITYEFGRIANRYITKNPPHEIKIQTEIHVKYNYDVHGFDVKIGGDVCDFVR
jgi:hypothetical protein